MKTLIQRLGVSRRKLVHLKRLETRIWHLKYEILNDALNYKIVDIKIELFHKYNKRLKLITFFK
jgi:hypothetical protein